MIQLKSIMGKFNVQMMGNEKELAADALIAVKGIYDALKKNRGTKEAEDFKEFFLYFINDPEVSPLLKKSESDSEEPKDSDSKVKSVKIRFPWQKDKEDAM